MLESFHCSIRLAIGNVLATGLFVLAACSNHHPLDDPPRNNSISNDELTVYERPIGDELSVTLKEVGNLQLSVGVKNQSKRDVFISYQPGIASEQSSFALTGLEKLNAESEVFESAESINFDPGWQVLRSGEQFAYSFLVLRPGTYRTNIRYFVDPKFKERTNANYELFYSDPDYWREDIKHYENIAKKVIGRSASNRVNL